MYLKTIIFRPLILIILTVGPGAVIAKEWYEGGTLHKSTGAQWRVAPADNRLATSADFATSLRKPRTMTEMRANAENLEVCISKTVGGHASDTMKVTEIAAMCASILGYGK